MRKEIEMQTEDKYKGYYRNLEKDEDLLRQKAQQIIAEGGKDYTASLLRINRIFNSADYPPLGGMSAIQKKCIADLDQLDDEERSAHECL
jgi:hypothetical protein